MRNGVTSTLGVQMNAELLEASARCWALLAAQMAGNSASTSHQNEVILAALQNAVNVEKAKAKLSTRKNTSTTASTPRFVTTVESSPPFVLFLVQGYA